mgnify:CR=1 FL=1
MDSPTVYRHRRDHPRIRGEHVGDGEVFDVLLVDHPRIRGEHTYMPEAGFPVTGSSPHTRGARPRDTKP